MSSYHDIMKLGVAQDQPFLFLRFGVFYIKDIDILSNSYCCWLRFIFESPLLLQYIFQFLLFARVDR